MRPQTRLLSASVRVAVLAFVFAAAAPAFAQSLPLNTSNWTLSYAYQTSNKGITLSALTQSSIQYAFPLSTSTGNPSKPYLTGEWAGYLQYAVPGTKKSLGSLSLSGTLTMTGSIATSGPGVVFNYKSEAANTCISPATLRPEFEGINAAGQQDRWWSTTAVLLQPGPFSISVPVDPAYWSNVNGEMANQDSTTLANFNAARGSAYLIGATHGGGCFYGHGVNVSGGTATLTLTGYSINP